MIVQDESANVSRSVESYPARREDRKQDGAQCRAWTVATLGYVGKGDSGVGCGRKLMERKVKINVKGGK